MIKLMGNPTLRCFDTFFVCHYLGMGVFQNRMHCIQIFSHLYCIYNLLYCPDQNPQNLIYYIDDHSLRIHIINYNIFKYMINLQQQITSERFPYNISLHKTTYYGFRGNMFPLLGAFTALISIIWSYYVAITNTPHHIKPFPQTDITHCGIRFPEYAIYRIGMLVSPVLLLFSFQLLKNYLECKCFEILGQTNPKLKIFTPFAIIAAIFLCVSTSTMSDGGDMNWLLHIIGARVFFIISIWLVLRASKIYRILWVHKHFCPEWSYQIKKYSNFILIVIAVLQIITMIDREDIGYFLEWFSTFYIMAFFITLYWDMKGFDMVLTRV